MTSIPQSINGKVVKPGEEVCSLAYYDEASIKLLRVSDKPYYNPVILSEKYENNAIIKIPEKDALGVPITKYALHFYLQNGEARIHYNSLDNTPPLKLYQGCKWNIRTFDRNIDKVIVDGITDKFTLFVIIERLV